MPEEIQKGIYLLDINLYGIRNFGSVYLLKDEKCALIDTGPALSHNILIDELMELGLKPQSIDYVFLTHVHLDHGGGLGNMVKATKKVKIIAHEKAIKHIIDPVRLWQSAEKTLGNLAEKLGNPLSVPIENVIKGYDGALFRLGKFKVRVVETLGHTYHHFSFFEENSKVLFPGDAAGGYVAKCLFPSSVPPSFNLIQSRASINKLIKINPKVICYPHFGYTENAIHLLQRSDDQLKLWKDILTDSIKKGLQDDEVLAEILNEDIELKKLKQIKENKIKQEKMINKYLELALEGFLNYLKN